MKELFPYDQGGFRLIQETAQDGERIQAERDQKATDQAKAEKKQCLIGFKSSPGSENDFQAYLESLPINKLAVTWSDAKRTFAFTTHEIAQAMIYTGNPYGHNKARGLHGTTLAEERAILLKYGYTEVQDD